jgi:hypothetical protein
MIAAEEKSMKLIRRLDNRAWSLIYNEQNELSTYFREILQQKSESIFAHIVRQD